MQHIENNLKRIKRRIMLRVWYTYALSIALNPFTMAGFVFGASATLFLSLVSVQNVLANLLEVRLGAVPKYIGQVLLNTWLQGDFLKIVSLILIVASLFYLKVLLRHSSFTRDFTEVSLRG